MPGGADATNPVRRRLEVEKPPLRIEDRTAGEIAGRRQERRVLDHRLRRARPGDLRGDRRDAVAELVERQILEHDVDQAPERRRRVVAVEIVAVLDVLPDQPVRLLVLGAQVDPETVLGVVGVGAGARAQIRDQPVAGPDPQDPAGRPLAERDREVREIPVLDDLLAAAEQAAAFLSGVLVLVDVGRPDHRARDLLDPEPDRDHPAIGRGGDLEVAKARPLDLRSAGAEQEAAEQRACRRADRTEGVAAGGDQPEPADRGGELRGHQNPDPPARP